MDGFGDHELMEMAAAEAEAMPHQCIIRNQTEVRDSGGGATETWTNQGTSFSCSIESASSGAAQRLQERLGLSELIEIRVPLGLDVQHIDRILVQDLNRELDIQFVPSASDFETATVLYAIWES